MGNIAHPAVGAALASGLRPCLVAVILLAAPSRQFVLDGLRGAGVKPRTLA